MLPWGICKDIFQEIMKELINRLDYIGTYIDDPLIISNKSSEDHIKRLEKVLSKLKLCCCKLNTEKFHQK